MMIQCNQCGSYEGLRPCRHCTTVMCDNCRVPHETPCEQIQQSKALGLGPTVREVGLLKPVSPTPATPDVVEETPRLVTKPSILSAPYNLTGPHASVVVAEPIAEFVSPRGELFGFPLGDGPWGVEAEMLAESAKLTEEPVANDVQPEVPSAPDVPSTESTESEVRAVLDSVSPEAEPSVRDQPSDATA